MGPSAPRGFSLSGRCEDLWFFHDRSIADSSRAQIWAQSGRKWIITWGWTNTTCLWAASCSLGESKSKKNHFFPPNPPQVPAQRAQGVLCSQLFPSQPSPSLLQNTELGKPSAPPAHPTLQNPLALGLSLPRDRGRGCPGSVAAVPPFPQPFPKSCLYLLAPVDSPSPGEPPGRAEAKAK